MYQWHNYVTYVFKFLENSLKVEQITVIYNNIRKMTVKNSKHFHSISHVKLCEILVKILN